MEDTVLVKKQYLSNPLAAPQPPKDKYERLWDALFAEYEWLDTVVAADNALRNIEQAKSAAEDWVKAHTDEDGKWTNANGRSDGVMLELEDSFSCEAHALALLSSIYLRREELLAKAEKSKEDSDAG